MTGSPECDKCAVGYYRPSADSSASECSSCGVIWGVSCGFDATIATANLTVGAWRHSNLTLETWPCKSMGGWTPCRGGTSAGHEGNGYCADGHIGPRCELCDGEKYARYFDKLDARCHDCGDVTTKAAIVYCAIFVALVAAISGGAATTRRARCAKARAAVLKEIRSAQKLWLKAGMRYKVKMVV